MTTKRMSNNTRPSQGAWLAFTANDFINRVKILAEKHGVTITYLDMSRKQIYFDCEYGQRYGFAVELNEIVEDFKRTAPGLFEHTTIQPIARTVHGWIKDLTRGEEKP